MADYLKQSLAPKLGSSGYFDAEYECALQAKDACLIKLFLMHHQKLKRLRYQALMEAFFSRDCVGALPDFQFTVKWHCDSDFIPFLSRLAPHDTIQVFRSQRLNILRIDFNQPQSGSLSEAGRGTKRPMTLVFLDGAIQLIDHVSKTISCDLYDLLIGGQTHEEDSFDGQAFELANSHVVSEKQIIELNAEKELSRCPNLIKKKIEVSLQQWEQHRLEILDENPQLEEAADRSNGSFKDVQMSEKKLPIDVSLRQEEHLRQ